MVTSMKRLKRFLCSTISLIKKTNETRDKPQSNGVSKGPVELQGYKGDIDKGSVTSL